MRHPLSSTRWSRLRLVILRRDGYRCHWCGNRATEADHLVARALGGAMYDPANLVAACKPCNARRGQATGEALKRGTKTREPRHWRGTWVRSTGAIRL